MSKHFFFIDDSGSKNWDTPYARDFVDRPPDRSPEHLKFWRGNYFVLAGVHLTSDVIAEIGKNADALKESFFGTKHVEIKSEWLRNPVQKKKRYIDPFSVTDEKLVEFVDAWYRLFADHHVQIQAFVLDKRYFGTRGRVHTPLQLLSQVLFDRIERYPSKEAIIVFDQMDREIKSEKRAHGEILKISDKVVDLGSFHEKYTHMRPRFEKSCRSHFLQMADTVAYNVYRQFVDHGDKWDGAENERLPMYPYLERLEKNFYHAKGRVSGIGIVKVPDPKKIRWGFDS